MKYLNQIISEIRKSEKISGKADKLSELGHQSAINFIKTNKLNFNNHGISMTRIPKVGINPKSTYDTPIGIYFYPMDFYVETITDGDRLPWQHTAKYINILEFLNPDRILSLTDTSISEKDIIERLKSIDVIKVSETLIQFIDESHIDSFEEARRRKLPGGRIWYVLWDLSKHLSKQSKIYFGTNSKPAVIWNWLLRKLGFDIILDNGEGIIHENEPTQGFAVSNRVIKWIKTIDNIQDEDLFQRKEKRSFYSILYGDNINDKSIIDKLSSINFGIAVPLYQNINKKIIDIINKKATPEMKKELIIKYPRLYYHLEVDKTTLSKLREKLLSNINSFSNTTKTNTPFLDNLNKITDLREFFNIYFLSKIPANERCNNIYYILNIMFPNDIQLQLDASSDEFKAAYIYFLSRCPAYRYTTDVNYIPDSFVLKYMIDNFIEEFVTLKSFDKIQEKNKDYLDIIRYYFSKADKHNLSNDRWNIITSVLSHEPFFIDGVTYLESFFKEFSKELTQEEIKTIKELFNV